MGFGLDGFAAGSDRGGEEPDRSLTVTLLGHENVDDLAELVDDAIHVAPITSDLHIGLIDEPAVTNRMATRPCRIHQQRSEPLHPSEQGHVVNLDAALGQEFLEVPVRQAEPSRVDQALACALLRAGLSCSAALGSFSSALALTPSAIRSPSALSTLRQ